LSERKEIPLWARDKMFLHKKGAFPFPELPFSRKEFHFD
jgi:hypothetical protein